MNYKFIFKAYLRTIMATTMIFNAIVNNSFQTQAAPPNKSIRLIKIVNKKNIASSRQTEYLNNKINQLSQIYGTSRETLLKLYAMEGILKRISVSQYCNNFVLKGGYLCYSLLGLDKRIPPDMDFYLHDLTNDKNSIIKIWNEILAINSKDNIKFKILKVHPIKTGFKLHVICLIDNFETSFCIDCSTEKRIVHKSTHYDLNLLFENKKINVLASTIESLLADKIASSIHKSCNNARIKDYYDIWALYKSYSDKINPQQLMETFKLTCEFKNIHNLNYKESLKTMRNSPKLKENWNTYQKQNSFAKNIDLLQVFDLIENIIQRYHLL